MACFTLRRDQGIFRTCPIRSRVPVSPFSFWIAAAVVLKRAATELRESPFFTV